MPDTVLNEWKALLERQPEPRLSQDPAYYQSYLDNFCPGASDALVVCVCRDSTLLAVIPLRCAERRVFPGIRAKALTFPDLPMPVRDALIDHRCSTADILTFVRDQLGKAAGIAWDYLNLRAVLKGSALVPGGAVSHMPPMLQRQIGVSHALDVSAPGYVASKLNSKARNNLRRNQKKLAHLGRYEFRTVAALPALDSAFEAFLNAEAAGWKSVRGGKRAVKLHKDQTGFYRDLMRRVAPQRRCHIHLLLLDGRAIAADYCILSGDTCYSLKHGYDEEFSSVAPGNLLREYTVEFYGDQPEIRTLDLISDQQWHLAWRPHRRPVFDIKLFNRTLLGRLLYYFFRSRVARQNQQ